MKVLDIQCVHGHVFEGWFASEADFVGQRDRDFVQCPLCGSSSVSKMLSAPRLNLSSQREDGIKTAGSEPSRDSNQQVSANDGVAAAWLAIARQVVANTVDVGPRFAEEARKIHYGEVKERNIRGNTTALEARSLLEEGIAVVPFLLPEALKETLQ